MINGVRIKVCGLTSAEDAHLAVDAGADYLGFIFFPGSPRAVTLRGMMKFAAELPGVPLVAVSVEPTVDEVRAQITAGFRFFQIYFRPETPVSTIATWSNVAGPESLWLAPKLPPGADVRSEVLPLAETFLLDTFDPKKFGGTGRPGDWGKFARHRTSNPSKTWVLSGGLAPDNLADAVRSTGARFVDVNSGVESSPGKKDRAKLAALSGAFDT